MAKFVTETNSELSFMCLHLNEKKLISALKYIRKIALNRLIVFYVLQPHPLITNNLPHMFEYPDNLIK